jgi:hypothetical protein
MLPEPGSHAWRKEIAEAMRARLRLFLKTGA